MVGYPDHPCPVCKGPMAEQKESACSGRCRAALSRRMRAEAQEERERRMQALLRETLRLLKHEGEDSA